MAMINGKKAPWVTSEDIEKARGRLIKSRGTASKYTALLAADICQRIEDGETLTSICKLPGFPALSTVYDWEGALPEFAEALARARRRSAHTLADKCLDIINGTDKAPDLVKVRSGEMRSKYHLELAKVRDRAYYGDKVAVSHDVVIESMADRLKRLTGSAVTIPAQFSHIIEK